MFTIDFKKYYIKFNYIISFRNDIDYFNIRIHKPEFYFSEYRENKHALWKFYLGYLIIIKKSKKESWK